LPEFLERINGIDRILPSPAGEKENPVEKEDVTLKVTG
jgi:hypothetical protein